MAKWEAVLYIVVLTLLSGMAGFEAGREKGWHDGFNAAVSVEKR